jgi:putative ABC transport system permease protein
MRWRRYFERSRRDGELAQEIAHYIAQETEDNIARGMNPADARLAALRRFGNRQSVRETVYRMNSINWLEVILQDLRYGLRQLWRRPGFALAAIVSLALGIGANTAIFTLVDQIVLRLLPVEKPHELVRLRLDGVRPGGNWGDGTHTFPYPTFIALRDRNTVFSGVTGRRVELVSLLDDERSAAVSVALVAGNYFEVLGVRSELGRLLTPDDDRESNGQPVAVLQHDFWQSQYQGRRGVIGESIRLNGKPFTVVGVAAAGFEGTDVGVPTKIFVPVSMMPTIVPNNPSLQDERAAWFYPFARLKPAVTIAQAEAAMKVLYRQRQQEELGQAYFSRLPETRNEFLEQRFTLEPGDRGDSGLRSRFEQPLTVLGWLAAAVLLIACANIAGLLLARGAAGQRDLAIRRAIGASRGRIVGQLFAESVLLAVISAIAALFLASWLTRFLIAWIPSSTGDLSLSATPDLRVIIFTIVVAGGTAVLFGLLPAWQNSRTGPADTLREQSGAIAGGRTHLRIRKLFIGLQVGLSAVLLLGAGLFVRSLDNLRRVELGLQSDHVITSLACQAVPHDNARKAQAYRGLLEGLATVPGVRAVGANRTPLFTGGRTDGPITIAGQAGTGTEFPFTFFNAVTPGYFETLGIPLRGGAPFTWRDWGTGKRLAFVNETLTATAFPGASPIGRLIGSGTRSETNVEIVGIFGDARYHDVRGPIPPQTFFNLDSVLDRVSRIAVYVRVARDERQMMHVLPGEIRRIDPNILVSDLRTLDDQINTRMSNERMLSFLSIGFAVLATILAIVGVHGVLVFQVARRTREIGVRMALGAGRAGIVRLVASEMALLILAGLAAGVAVAYGGGRYVQSQLFGLDADDPLVFGAAVGILLVSAAVATLMPALRASRIEVVRALRCE